MPANYIIPFQAELFFTHFGMAFIPSFQWAIDNWQYAKASEIHGVKSKRTVFIRKTRTTGRRRLFYCRFLVCK